MKQQQFEALRRPTWQAFESLLVDIKKKKRTATGQFPLMYRQICHDLALAQSRQYHTQLIDELNLLAMQGHHVLYSTQTPIWGAIWLFIRAGFPQLVRQEWRIILIAALVFLIPAAIMLIGIQYEPQLVYSVTSPGQVAEFESMYNPKAEHFLRPREAQTDIAMFGFYIRNNIGINFQAFASGMVLGIGSLFYLVFNGLHLGAVAGHLTRIGYTEHFWSFVVGHSSFEMIALVIATAAGLKLGLSILFPQRRGRFAAIKHTGRISIRLVYGAATMTFIAAMIEAFWSSSAVIPPSIKYVVGGTGWILLLLYFLMAGRRHAT